MQSQKTIEKIYYYLTSLFWLATALPLAIFVLFIQSRGVNLFEVGILMGVYSMAIVILEVPTGGLADAVGRKKVALLAYGFSIIATIILLFSFNFTQILIGFIFMGVARALSSGTLDAWFVDTLQRIDPEVDLQPLFSKAGTYTLLSLGLGTLFGSSIPNLFSSLPINSNLILSPLSIPIIFSCILYLILILSTAALVKENLQSNHQENWIDGFKKMPEIIKTGLALSRQNPIILLLFGTSTAAGFALSGIESFWQPHFADILGGIQGNSFYFGIIMGGNFIVGMVGNMFATAISKILKKRYALVAAIFQGLWGLMLFWLASQTLPIPSMIVFWLTYLSMGVINSPHQTLLNQEIPSKQRSAMLSIASLFSYIGGMLGGVILGFFAENKSIIFSWQIAGFVLVLSLILYRQVDVLQKEKDLTLATSDKG